MRLKATILLAIAVVLLSVCAEAKTLTLKEAVQTAIKANPEIKAYKATWESAKAKIPQAVSFPDPQIGLEYDQIPSGSRNPEDGMKMYTAEQMIPFPSKIYTDWQIANSLADEASALYRSKALEIISDVKSAYYDLFFLDRSINIYKEIKDELSQIKAAADLRYSIGDASYTSVLQSNVEYLLANNELLNLLLQREVREAKLGVLLSRIETIETEATLDLPKTLEAEVDLEKYALVNNPDVVRAKASLGKADLEHLRSKTDFLPDTTLGARKRVDDGWDAMVSFSVPLYFWKQGYGVASAGSEREAAEADYKNAINTITWELKDKYVEAANSKRTADLYQKTILPQSDQALKSALASYQTGKIDFQELLQVERMYKEAKIKFYETQVNYGKALSELEKIVGREII